MVPMARKAFNESFTEERYKQFLNDLHSRHPGAIQFRIAETPVFVDKQFTKKMIDACESIVDLIVDPSFINLTERSIPSTDRVPGKEGVSNMIAFDFGICINEQNELEPQLIEMQGFPTLFGFQVYYPETLRRHFPIPGNYTQYLGGYTKESYLRDLKSMLLGDFPVEQVI